MTDLGAYSGLFLSAFVAATLLPTASEAVLVALLLAGVQPTEMPILVASVGNVLGSVLIALHFLPQTPTCYSSQRDDESKYQGSGRHDASY